MNTPASLRFPDRFPCLSAAWMILAGLTLVQFEATAAAQVTTNITAHGLRTDVAPPENGLYNITGGTRVGTNLFHSFLDFTVGQGDTANFLNRGSFDLNGVLLGDGLDTSYILARVEGGNLSLIHGAIQTSEFGAANLFLVNPMGFLFGPGASVNTGGMVAFTSADYLKFADEGRFHALANPVTDAVLSMDSVAQFGFLGTDPGAITVQGSQFVVAAGKSLSFVGGDITIGADPDTGTPAMLAAPAGELHLASVKSPGEILYPTLQTGPNINGQSFTAMGTIRADEGSFLDVSDNNFDAEGVGGTIRIRGGKFELDNGSFLMANTFGDVDGAPTAVSVAMQGDIDILNGSGIAVQSSGAGNLGRIGDVEVSGQNIMLDGSSFIFTSNDSAPGVPVAPGSGVLDFGGNLTATATDTFNVFGGSTIQTFGSGSSNAGNISLTTSPTGLLSISGMDPFGNSSSFQSLSNGTGNTGRIDIAAGSTTIEGGGFVMTNSFGTGDSGNLNFNIQGSLNLANGGAIITTGGTNSSGNITATADSITISGQFNQFAPSKIVNTGGGVATGDVTLTARQVIVTDSGRVNLETNSGQAGTIRMTATESMTVGPLGKIRMNTSGASESGLMDLTAPTFTMNQGILQTLTIGAGDASAIKIAADNATISGSQINSTTQQLGGKGGDVTLTIANNLTISGQFAGNAATGDAPGQAGIFSETGATGAGGNIFASAGEGIFMNNGAALSASSTSTAPGAGNAGNLTLNAGHTFYAENSSVTTSSANAGGGNITINAIDLIRLINTPINASAMLNGGNIDIDPTYVVLQNSPITANAILGNGGNIFITTNFLLADAGSTISASSQFGQNGTISIQSPISPSSGKIVPLGKSLLDAKSLTTQRCAAMAGGELSSFTVAGRDTVPLEPGSWLSSPLASLDLDTEVAAARFAPAQTAPADDAPMLSLRQIAPPGFLTRAFAEDWAGCAS